MEEKWIKHYSSRHQILLVGEGDFSFSLSLTNAFGSATNMVATSLDSKDKVMWKYPGVTRILAELDVRGCKIIHEVDAKSMHFHPQLYDRKFDRIVFNFPHAGFAFKETDQYQIGVHKRVVEGFFENACKMLNVFGEIHVTHKTTYPYSEWKIVEMAEESGLRLIEEASFSKYAYPGYTNKRGDGDRSYETFRIGQCSTFKFGIPCGTFVSQE